MATKVYDAQDYQLNEIQNVRLQSLASDPANTEAQVYWNSSTKKIRVYNGTAWVDVATGAGYTDEQAQDAIAAAFAAGTQAGVTVSYNDGANSFSIAVANDESMQDVIAAFLTASTVTGITVTYNDAGNVLVFTVATLNNLPAPTGDLSLNSQKITNLANGSAATDAVNLGQVQALVNGMDWKANVRAVAVANVNIANGLENGDAIDGVTLATGDRVLLTGQTAPAENGIYVAVASGAASRSTDADVNAEVTSGLTVAATEGTTYGDTVWILTTNDPIVVGTTGLVFTQLPTPNAVLAGNGIVRTGQTLSVDPAIVARKATGTLTGGATSEVLTHNLNTRNVVVIVRNNAAPYDRVEVTDEATTVNTVTVRSGALVLPAGYTWTITG